jgi:hypothetical protein
VLPQPRMNISVHERLTTPYQEQKSGNCPVQSKPRRRVFVELFRWERKVTCSEILMSIRCQHLNLGVMTSRERGGIVGPSLNFFFPVVGICVFLCSLLFPCSLYAYVRSYSFFTCRQRRGCTGR